MMASLSTAMGQLDCRQTHDSSIVNFMRAQVVDPASNAERFHAVFLDDSRAFLGDAPLGRGGTGSLTVRMREIFRLALAFDAHGIILAHNHPSGRCRPSKRDIAATCRLNKVAEALDLALLDHLILTQDSAYSMRAGGKL